MYTCMYPLFLNTYTCIHTYTYIYIYIYIACVLLRWRFSMPTIVCADFFAPECSIVLPKESPPPRRVEVSGCLRGDREVRITRPVPDVDARAGALLLQSWQPLRQGCDPTCYRSSESRLWSCVKERLRRIRGPVQAGVGESWTTCQTNPVHAQSVWRVQRPPYGQRACGEAAPARIQSLMYFSPILQHLRTRSCQDSQITTMAEMPDHKLLAKWAPNNVGPYKDPQRCTSHALPHLGKGETNASSNCQRSLTFKRFRVLQVGLLQAGPILSYVCVYIYIYIYVWERTQYIYIYIYTYMYRCIHVYLSLSIYIYIYTQSYVHPPTADEGGEPWLHRQEPQPVELLPSERFAGRPRFRSPMFMIMMMMIIIMITISLSLSLSSYVYVYVYIYISIHISLSISLSLSLSLYIHICICVYIYIYVTPSCEWDLASSKCPKSEVSVRKLSAIV